VLMSTAPAPLFLRIRSASYRIGIRWDGLQPLTIGRGGGNGVVLSDPSISTAHVRIVQDGGRLQVTDLNSRNGTRIGTSPVEGTAAFHPGQTLELAGRVWITPLRDLADGAERMGWALKLAGRPGLLLVPREATLLSELVPGVPENPQRTIHATRRVHLTGPDGPRELGNGDTFQVGSVELRVLRPGARVTTAPQLPVDDLRWTLIVSGATTRPSVRIRSRDGSVECAFRPAHSATLLMLLAARQQESAPSPGWAWDDDLRVGLWGRSGLEADPNNLNVVLYRIRRRLQSVGILDELILKEPNRTRLGRCAVRLEDTPSSG
jgi:hypothetical protein